MCFRVFVTLKLTKGGKAVGSGSSVVSADGKTLTLTPKGTDASGKTVSSVSVYHKQQLYSNRINNQLFATYL